MMFGFKKAGENRTGGKKQTVSYDPAQQKPVIRCSICNGEQVAGFQDLRTGKMEEVCLIRSEEDLLDFRTRYGITGEIEKIY